MTLGEFQKEMARLNEQFGKNTYSQARTEIIWREVRVFNRTWWEKTVDHFLITCRHAPLYQEFSEEIGKERERLWQIEKRQNEKDAKDFFAGTYQPEDVRTICQMIKKRLQGGVLDKDYSTFIEHLQYTSNHSEARKK